MSTILGNPITLGSGGGNELIVTAPTGSTITATKGSVTKTATEKNGTWTFKGLEAGDWEIVATKGSDIKTITVTITNESAEIHYRPNFTYTGDWEWYNEEQTIVKLKTSGVITFDSDFPADVFVVGGGASGAGSSANYMGQRSGGGGGGGYTKTERVSFVKDTEYSAIIGSGGASVSNTSGSNGNVGGDTSINGISAGGGKTGTSGNGGSSTGYYKGHGHGGNGGSGGGAAFWSSSSYTGYGGSNGGNGETVRDSYYIYSGGTGQATTTRAFGEPTGELFAGGGGGAICNSSGTISTPNGGAGGGGNGGGSNGTREATAGQENTGGGGGGVYYANSNYTRYSGAGGSGVILIRFV